MIWPSRRAIPLIAPILLALAADSAAAQDIPLKTIDPDGFSRIIAAETSELRVSGRPPYDPRSLWDGRTWSAWACDNAENTWIEVQFPAPRYVVQLRILSGDASSTTAWRASRRPKILRVVHDTGQFTIDLKDSLALQTVAFPEAIATSRVRLEVVGTWGYGPVAISEMAFLEPEDIFDLKPNLRADIETHIGALRDLDQREEASKILEVIGAPALPRILETLDHPHPLMREGAARLLQRSGVPEGLEPIMSAARATLGRDKAFKDPRERAFMAAALSYLGDQHAVRGAVLARSMYRKDVWREAMAVDIVRALAKSGHPEVTPLLIDAMRSDDPAVAQAAVPAFARLGQPGVAGLLDLSKDDNPEIRRRAAQALEHFDRPRARLVANRLMDDASRPVRVQAVRSLGASGLPAWRGALMEAARDDHPAIRRAAATALGRYPEPEIAERLSELCRDRDSRVRQDAVSGLEAHGAPSMSLLVSLVSLDDTEFPGLPESARKSLGRLAQHHGPALVDLLAAAIEDKTQTASDRQHMAHIMARCGTAGAKALLEMLEGDNTSLAFYSLRALEARPHHALSHIQSKLAPAPFKELERSLAVRYLQIASATGDPAWVDRLELVMDDPRDYIRAEVTRALGRFDTPRAHKRLIQALDDPWEDVRFEAMKSLGNHKVRTAVPKLMSMVRRHDVKMLRAVKALGQIGDPRALPVLYEMLTHDRASIRQRACMAIGEIGEPDSMGHLIKVINDEDDFVRFYATRALNSL